MQEEKHIKLSRFLSLILRHKPEEIGLTLDSQGYLEVEKLLQGINNTGRKIDKDTLDEIVASDNKQRYSYNHDKTKIRANQGHSIKVDLGLVNSKPPEFLYHGTVERFLDNIGKHGLLKMNREYVHLSKDIETAKNVGARRGEPVILIVNAEQMYNDGYDFYLSENGVWLTEKVPAKYLSIKII